MKKIAILCFAIIFGWVASISPKAAAETVLNGAPKPLYRDPVYDGAADASLVFDHARKEWVMFYTNRRASLKFADPKDVSWVHGTPIGMARSVNGLQWRFAGQATFPKACSGETLWAPELYYEAGTYHMWLTVVPGIYRRWGGATSKIVHLTSSDLRQWACSDTVDTGSQRSIDASVIKLGSAHYRLWYKDERAGSRLFALDSPDLRSWTKVLDKPVIDTNAEGPKVFLFKGFYWMIADKWDGLLVLRSKDGLKWDLQSDKILRDAGTMATDRAKGQHPDIIVTGKGKSQRAFIYYFVHQGQEPQGQTDPYWNQRTVIQVAELVYKDASLSVDRNAVVTKSLEPPSP